MLTCEIMKTLIEWKNKNTKKNKALIIRKIE